MSINICVYYSIIRKRRKDKTYENPEASETEAHPYQNIPDNRSGEITHPYQNIPDNRLGGKAHQPKQNNELVHQENDPYTSIQEMEYLENDLYISSGDVTDDDKLKAQLPVVAEYAQVNKSNANKTTNGNCKTGPKGDNYAVVNKFRKMINNDKQFKIGPSGDQYTLVNKVRGGSTNN
ncbi:hypothetical protein SNE40_013497 [Patella caerulea]|uniref:Uncharacterized protein n=1 Tax=Patella caerulea TaxID=87958 RepID=A0AAN8PQT4_PATCE